jgi:FkbM family methyltransferase
MVIIKYGIINNNIDVTDIALTKCMKQNIIFIPKNDSARAKYFSDPLVNILKSIFIIINNTWIEFDDNKNVYIDIINNQIYTDENVPESIRELHETIYEKLINNIHSQLKIEYGSLTDEFPEQMMAVTHLTGNEKVLEIGGNIGRNSLIIGHILKEKQNNNFVTLECDVDICKQLIHNRDINNMTFYIENSALSKRKLIQRNWETIVSDVVLPGYKPVSILSYDELKNKYNIDFDTLVLDCEGAFYYILMDMPEILNGINLIIMENDYNDYNHKLFIDDVLIKNNFNVVYQEEGGWGPCYTMFFEVWKKNIIQS